MLYKLSKKKLANALRFLSIDAIHLANSGHPGMPLGMADIAEVLWNDFLIHNPRNPQWINRDRFVMSNGHGSILQYALLHLSGYQLTIEDLKNFRKLHSKTPGHPEYGATPGVNATTGPLGQGLGMSVGMALAEKLLASKFNKEHFNIIDHHTYCFVGDGCLMEGVSHEACSLAGTLGLNKLIVFWDHNRVSIDGSTENWFTENIAQRFRAYNWNVIENIDGHDPDSITKAIVLARLENNKPSLLCCRTIIGYGSSVAGTSKAHGTPFNKEEIALIRKNLSWEEPAFFIPEDIYAAWKSSSLKAGAKNIFWDKKLKEYKQNYPALFEELNRRLNNILPSNLDDIINELLIEHLHNPQVLATRQSSKLFLDAISTQLPELFGGSADLGCSDLTLHTNAIAFKVHDDHFKFNYLHFGVREFGMFCILNGMSLHKGFIAYGGTFLAFIDYAKSALRLSCLMQNKLIYVLTHDSIGVGEDGPTHQPIEHIAMLRMVPNIYLWRPCDTIETIFAWRFALYNNSTTCLILTRQAVIPPKRDLSMLSNIQYGGYILQEAVSEEQEIPNIIDSEKADLNVIKLESTSQDPTVIIIATGSEVDLAILSAEKLASMHIKVRVVSIPCVEIFLQQPIEYLEQVLPSRITRRVAIEAGSTLMWHKFVGPEGRVIGVDSFGGSGRGSDLYEEFGITIDNIVQTVLSILEY